MSKQKSMTLEKAKEIEDRLSKEYPDKEPFPLAKVLSNLPKKKTVPTPPIKGSKVLKKKKK